MKRDVDTRTTTKKKEQTTKQCVNFPLCSLLIGRGRDSLNKNYAVRANATELKKRRPYVEMLASSLYLLPLIFIDHTKVIKSSKRKFHSFGALCVCARHWTFNLL